MGTMNDWTEAEVRAERARELYDDGRLAEAAAELRAAIGVNPYNPSWHFNLGLTLEAMDDHGRACMAYEAALELSPDDIEALNCLGVSMNRQGRYAEALEQFQRIERIDPGYEPAYCNRIVSYTELGEHDKAEVMFYLARLFKDECPLCCYNIGNSFYNSGQYGRAIDCWKQTLRIDPTHPQANARIADAYWAQDRLATAGEYYECELGLYPDDADTRLDYGELLVQQRRLEAAERQFRRVLEDDPEHAGAYFALGSLALPLGRLDEAERLFQLVLRIDAEYPGAHARLGQIMLRRGRRSRAAGHFLAELKRSGNDASALAELGRLLLEAGQLRHAHAVFQRLTWLRPDDPQAHHNLAVCCFRLERMDEGIRHCRHAVKLRPDYSLALYNLALAHYRTGSRARAQRYVSRAMALAPKQDAIRRLARQLRADGFWGRLRQTLRRAIGRGETP